MISQLSALPQGQPQPLDTLSFPLYGVRLIEASAGTGKTYTLAGLYLRLLLGHGLADAQGMPTAHVRPLAVTEILVVTFTEAATAELRGRIRSRIHEARLAFLRSQLPPGKQDPFLAQLLLDLTDHATAARLLLAAERQMDEAAIFTIHGFCQRMLRQNAFESGALFETELLTDESQLRLQAVCDYWRSEFYPLDRAVVQAVHKLWSGPQALLNALAPWLGKEELQILPALGDEQVAACHARAMAAIDAIKALWLAQQQAIRAQTEGQISRYTGKNYEGWLGKIEAWANDPETGYALPEPLVRFGQQALEANLKKGGVLPTLPLFTQIDELLAQKLGIRELVLQRAARQIRERMSSSKLREYQLSFDDLLKDLDRALGSTLGPRLCQRIRDLYRVAMIDEFQDTDPQQYRIFHRLYADEVTADEVAAEEATSEKATAPEAVDQANVVQGAAAEPREQSALLMIGDPKQAIYGFRGADIFTYIQARQRVAAHYTLGRNYRSSSALVAAVNALFQQAKDPFIYAADIPFLPVAAQGKQERLWVEGAEPPALTCWLHGARPTLNKGDYQADLARATASEISRLLSLAQSGQAKIGEKALKAGDMAVLVRTGAEGRLIQQALARLGIPSVYLSNRDSVFAQQEAADLLLLLQACQQPTDERKLRAALACALFDLNAGELEQLASDELAWEATVQEFRDYQRLWLRQGVLAMLHELLQRRQLAASLLGAAYGERRLTNVLHLGELLQQASMELDGEYALLRWLSEAIANPNGQAAEQVLRLESERKLVQIVTIHKSKGLEYPLVFLPFICAYRATDTPLYHEAGQTILDLSGEGALVKAERERLAEDLRLLYVALTRGIYATWLGLAPLRSGSGKSEVTDLHKSAIGYLLQQGEAGDASLLAAALERLRVAQPGVVVTPLPPLGQAFIPTLPPRPEPQVREFKGKLERNWWISSYTGLASHGGHELGVLATPGFDMEAQGERSPLLALSLAASLVGSQNQPPCTIFTFPRGAQAGTLLHSLFEQIDFVTVGTPAGDAELKAQIDTLLAQEGFDLQWAPVLQAQVQAVLATNLTPGVTPGLRLGDLAAKRKQVELEFMLPMAPLEARSLSTLMARHDPLSARAEVLSFQTVQGMLKGFIDLVFEWQGRWYLLDYKSNHLGDQVADYGPAQLEQAMLDHRYDLQYQLYTLALHRLLKQRLPGYDPARHLGGVFYLFLRGMPDGGVFHYQPSLAFIDALERLFCGEFGETV